MMQMREKEKASIRIPASFFSMFLLHSLACRRRPSRVQIESPFLSFLQDTEQNITQTLLVTLKENTGAYCFVHIE